MRGKLSRKMEEEAKNKNLDNPGFFFTRKRANHALANVPFHFYKHSLVRKRFQTPPRIHSRDITRINIC